MTGPRVAIVMPALAVNERIAAAVDSWRALADTHALTIIVVADRGDDVESSRDWADLRIEPWPRPAGWLGRDANARRSRGLALALDLDADFILFTDTKVRATPDAIARLIEWMAEPGRAARTEALAGCYFDPAVGQGAGRFFALYADHALLRKNPRFREPGVRLAKGDTEAADSWPVTGALLLTRRSGRILHDSGGLPADFRVSYEDYSAVQVMLDHGIEILCDGRFLVAHGNRTGFGDLIREYLRTGWAAAQFRRRFPHSAMARRRAAQAAILLSLLTAGLLAAMLAPAMALVAVLGFVLVFGVVNAASSQRPAALAFGPVFCISAVCFAAGYVHFHLRGGRLGAADARLYAMR